MTILGWAAAFVGGYVAGKVPEWWARAHGRRPPFWRLLDWLDYKRRERKALPDGTLVRLACMGCGFHEHDGIWRTEWTPRRLRDPQAPDNYHLTRLSDGETTYARRNAIEVMWS